MIELAWQEDVGAGDVTSEISIPEGERGEGRLVFREEGVLCGMPVVAAVIERYDAGLELVATTRDGERVAAKTVVGTIRGPMRSLLTAERVVLNFLQRLSGIATTTARYVAAIEGTGARVYDTRKTTPGWRALEKYAVRCGGGCNHRQGLYDAVLIKDNHLARLGGGDLQAGLEEAMKRLGDRAAQLAFVEVEVDALGQLEKVLAVEGVGIVLLDNMDCEPLREAVRMRDERGLKGKVELEASGNITLETIRAVAETGVERISAGALTHSVWALDIGLDIG